MELQTSEHLIYFMKHNLRLSRYDQRFLENLEILILHENRVTTNQVTLLHKIVNTYHRQFIKYDMFIEALVKLPWNVPLVTSSPEYVDTYITIEAADDVITCKTPYHRAFIQAIGKSTEHSFKWDNDAKIYSTSFSTGNLKFIVDTTKKHFNNIHLCPITTHLLAELCEFEDVKYWTPTLVYSNGLLFIAAINEALYNALSHIELAVDPITLSELVRYGITIDKSALERCTDAIASFASLYSPVVELSEVQDIVPWLQQLKCDCVYFSGGPILTTGKAALRKLLHSVDIACHEVGDPKTAVGSYFFPVILRFRAVSDLSYEPYKVAKVIKLVDSRPITIR